MCFFSFLVWCRKNIHIKNGKYLKNCFLKGKEIMIKKSIRKRIFAGLLAGSIILGTVAGGVSAYADEITESAVITEAAEEPSEPVDMSADEENRADADAKSADITPVEILLHIDVAPKIKSGTVYIRDKASGDEYTAAIVNGQVGIPLMPGKYSVTKIVDSKNNPVKDITEETITASHQVFATSQYSITNAKANDPMYKFITSQVDFLLNHVITFLIIIGLAIALYKIQKKKETIGKKE